MNSDQILLAMGILYAGLSWIMYLSPMKEIYAVRKQGKVSEKSPLPYVMMFFSCFLWCVWAVLKSDYVIFATCVIGLWSSLWYLLTLLPLSTSKRLAEIATMVGAISLSAFLFILMSFFRPNATQILGYVTSGFSISLFASPLTQTVPAATLRLESQTHYLFLL
eukprot:gb/GECH01005892.1/.p1 GENE.gb/GECH01005892.1/~~gb/GECH01005892.1/.p1  ORF type:complete len:164 (+),score=7.43 gb/GECH01005892.1/:1-492(+)